MQSKRDTIPVPTPVPTPHPRESSVERVTISQMPRAIEAASGERRTFAEIVELPTPWLERLVLLWSELPVNSGDNAVTRAVVDALSAMLDDHAVGACIVPVGGGAQEVIRTKGLEDEARTHPTRLFPTLARECVIEIESGGSTLHVASDDPSCVDPQTKIGALVVRASHALRRGLEAHPDAHARRRGHRRGSAR